MGLLVGAASAAQAGDLPNPVVINNQSFGSAPATYDWTGAYIGANIGYSWNKGHVKITVPSAEGDVTLNGLDYGASVGYNWQGTSNFLAGIRVDGGLSSVSKDGLSKKWNVDVLGKLGIAYDTVAVYALGGVAIGHFQLDSGSFSKGDTFVGYKLGAGVEKALSEHLLTSFEVAYAGYGAHTYDLGGGSKATLTPSGWSAMIGVKYKF